MMTQQWSQYPLWGHMPRRNSEHTNSLSWLNGVEHPNDWVPLRQVYKAAVNAAVCLLAGGGHFLSCVGLHTLFNMLLPLSPAATAVACCCPLSSTG